MRRYSGFFGVLAVLTIIGAINWGLIGFFNWNLVDAIFGGGSAEQTSTASRVVYALVGLSGLALAFGLPAAATEAPPTDVTGRREVLP